MQNSNLSSIIPNLNDSWQIFIQKVQEEISSIKTANHNDANRFKELEGYIAKLGEIKKICEKNPAEILNHRLFLLHIDNSLSKKNHFEALSYLKDNGNLDNDSVKMIYDEIMRSPGVVSLNEKYNNLELKLDFAKDQIKPLEDLVSGKKYDQVLIQNLLDKYDFNDEIKKNILFYSIVMMAIKQDEINNSLDDENKKEDKAKLYHDKIIELCNEYQNKKDDYKDLFAKCYSIIQKMDHDEIFMYKEYIDNPREAIKQGFNEVNIYVMSLLKMRKDIEDYIDGISDLEMEVHNLIDEIVFFKEMLDKFDKNIEKVSSLLKEKSENYEEVNDIFFALDPFNRLIMNKSLLINNIDSINSVTKKEFDDENNSSQELFESEELLKRKVYLLSTDNYKLAYVMVNNCVLVLGIDDNSNTKFNSILNRVVRTNLLAIRKQINLILQMDDNYIALQNEIKEDIMAKSDIKM